MNRDEYRAAFDRVKLSEDFQQNAVQRLTRLTGQRTEKEITTMKSKRMGKTVLLAAALAAALIVSAAAVVLALTPKDVAGRLSDPTLAAAFEREDAKLIDEIVETEGYTISLAGMVSGAGLSDYAQDLDAARTYAVLSLAHTDGTPIEEANLDLNFTPLVAGYEPRRVNAWTLGGGYSSFVHDGVAYYLFDCQSLEIFADHTVYLAVYQGDAPSNKSFAMAEDGAISFTDGVEGPHALLTLPLDASKADPAAVERLLAEIGIE